MQPIIRSEKLAQVHSDIRGPVYVEAMKMIGEGIPVLRLNTGNPATFGFTMPPSVRQALMENAEKAVGYCDFRGMPAARQAIVEYQTAKGIEGLTPDDIFVGNGVSEMAQFAITALLNYGDEILLPSPSYSLWTNVTLIAGAKPVFYTCDEQSDWYPDVEDIRRKLKRAVTDSDGEIRFDPETKPGVSNLLSILSALKNQTPEETAQSMQGMGYGALKEAVAEAIIAEFTPIQARYNEILADKEGLNAMLRRNAERAQYLAAKTLRKVYKKVGLYQF